MNIDKTIELLNEGKIKWSAHGLMRLQERDISIEDIKFSIRGGEIIESYPKEPPAISSVLIYGNTQDNKLIHIIVGYDVEQLYFVTAYYPNTDKFENDLKTRRKNNV